MKENSTERKPFTKSRLVKELSWTCELPQTKVKAILETLVEISRREARNTLVLPGICKLEVDLDKCDLTSPQAFLKEIL